MLLVKTFVGPSAIAGNGLFAAQDIPKGTVVWRFVEGFDEAFTSDEFLGMASEQRSRLVFHGYYNRTTKRWILCGDDANYVNHSENPNLGGGYDNPSSEGFEFALRDIKKGEELTDDYNTYDEAASLKLGGRLIGPTKNGIDFGVIQEIEKGLREKT